MSEPLNGIVFRKADLARKIIHEVMIQKPPEDASKHGDIRLTFVARRANQDGFLTSDYVDLSKDEMAQLINRIVQEWYKP